VKAAYRSDFLQVPVTQRPEQILTVCLKFRHRSQYQIYGPQLRTWAVTVICCLGVTSYYTDEPHVNAAWRWWGGGADVLWYCHP